MFRSLWRLEAKQKGMLIDMKEKDINPILAVPAVPHNDGIRFLLLDDQIDIDNTLSSAVWEILKYSNGYNSIKDISTLTNLDENLVHGIVNQLISLNIIYDSRELYKRFHKLSNAPDKFFRKLSYEEIIEYTCSPRKPYRQGAEIQFHKDYESNISKLIFARRSCRSFSTKKLSREIIGNICFCGYSIKNHAVPSGGGLYPLRLYVLIEEDQENLERGYYEYNSDKDILVKFNSEVDIEQLKYCFNDEILPFNSSVQIIIAADLERQTFKYSNRGYRLTLIEAGQVAQNISLYCQERQIGCCELGGVLDDALSKELGICDQEITPILSIAIGYPSEESCINIFDQLNNLEISLKDEIGLFGGRAYEEVPFYGAYAYYGINEDECAGATSTSLQGAMFKAIIEGYERKVSGKSKVDYFGCAKDIKGEWLHPYDIRTLTDEQIEYLKLTKFTNAVDIHWTKGYYYKNLHKEVFVPSDLVYYGKSYKCDNICFSDSSGVAAHTDYDTAVKLALLELIERDAIMRNWYKKNSPDIISYNELPIYVRKRIDYWKKKDKKVYVLDMGSKYAPTIQVIIVGNEYPCFVCGAASGVEKIEKITYKALREAEYSLIQRLNNCAKKKMDIKKICSPEDHGVFYSEYDNAKTLSWLWTSKNEKGLPKVLYNFDELINILNPIVIDLSENNSPIKVVRVISKNCIPISFGYNQDYYTHNEVDSSNMGIVPLPHYFD